MGALHTLPNSRHQLLDLTITLMRCTAHKCVWCHILVCNPYANFTSRTQTNEICAELLMDYVAEGLGTAAYHCVVSIAIIFT